MADETPEQIKERVLAEELAKGSDPRVAEGRAKAAEFRAREGLPIEPDQAWRAKLEREGGAPTQEAAPAVEGAPPAPPTAPSDQPIRESAQSQLEHPSAAAPPLAEAPAETAAAPEAPPTPAQERGEEHPTAAPAQAPSDSSEQAPPAVAEAPVSAELVAPPMEPEAEPEIGARVEVESESLEEYAGIKVRDSRLPVWLLVILVVVPLWAMFYMAAFAGSDAIERTSGCTVNADHTFTCFGR